VVKPFEPYAESPSERQIAADPPATPEAAPEDAASKPSPVYLVYVESLSAPRRVRADELRLQDGWFRFFLRTREVARYASHRVRAVEAEGSVEAPDIRQANER